MYHAPVPIDSDAPESDLAQEAVESAALDLGNERLRDAHLHNGQVEARALFAPFFAITAVAAVPGHRLGDVRLGEARAGGRLDRLGRLRQLGVLPRARSKPRRWGSSRTARPRTRWFAIAEAVGLAGLWSALADLRLRHPAARTSRS